jgi:hypothetical protein
MNLKKTVKIFVVSFGVIVILIQFIQPNRSNPEVDTALTLKSELNPPPYISSLLERGCKDCHSNETHWPFYAYVAPVSWLVTYDVSEGRKHFNMSEWGKYKTKRKYQKLSGIYQEVKDNSMPLPKYLIMHAEAKFTDAERDSLSSWAQTEAEKIMGGAEE